MVKETEIYAYYLVRFALLLGQPVLNGARIRGERERKKRVRLIRFYCSVDIMSRWDVQWRLERSDMFRRKRDAKRLLGRTRPKLEGNIEMDRKEIGCKGISS